jgi:hypothetical protein
MDLHPDFKDLLSALADTSAEYLVVGGWAFGYHAEPDSPTTWSQPNVRQAANATSGISSRRLPGGRSVAREPVSA